MEVIVDPKGLAYDVLRLTLGKNDVLMFKLKYAVPKDKAALYAESIRHLQQKIGVPCVMVGCDVDVMVVEKRLAEALDKE